MTEFDALVRDHFSGGRKRIAEATHRTFVRGDWLFVCRYKDGRIKWQEEIKNIVVTVGLNHYLDATLGGSTQITTWYIGLKGTGAAAAGDTMASHGGWSEVTAYSEANRQTWTKNGVASGGSITNSASPARFTSNANGTVVYGAFLTSNNTKGGTTGTLMAAGDFSLSKTIDNAETLDVTATFTQAAA
jgi:hypothetical protein